MNVDALLYRLAALILLFFIPCVSKGEDLNVLHTQIIGCDKTDMMQAYLSVQMDKFWERWENNYNTILNKTNNEKIQYHQHMRELFINALGGFSLKTDLHPRITGSVSRNGYRVYKLLFESRPSHHVTAVLYLPNSSEFSPPYPAVLVPCGHVNQTGLAWEPNQTLCASLALHGIAALMWDTICQGERAQGGECLDGEDSCAGSSGHADISIGSILVGRNTASYEIWDGIRALDYVQSRKDINPDKIGCVGQSGGGTQTAYLTALDDRIKASAPATYISGLYYQCRKMGPDDAEQNIFGQLKSGFDMDQANYLMMNTAVPVLCLFATQDFFPITGSRHMYELAKRYYISMDPAFENRIHKYEEDTPHDFTKGMREACVQWMLKWLKNEDLTVVESNIELLTAQELRVTQNGSVRDIPGEKTVYDINREYEKTILSPRRERLWENGALPERKDRICQLTGIRNLIQLPQPVVLELAVLNREGYQIQKVVIIPENGIYLPALICMPKFTELQGVIIYINEKGKHAEADIGQRLEGFAQSGYIVLAVDLRGSGETQQDNNAEGWRIGADYADAATAYLLGLSYVGMRTEDLLICTRWATDRFLKNSHRPVKLIAVGNLGIPALHAAALEPQLYESIEIENCLISWSNVVAIGMKTNNQFVNVVHAALTEYDLSDLANAIQPKLTIKNPVDAQGYRVHDNGCASKNQKDFEKIVKCSKVR